jgi:hypothetical protein
MAKDGAWHLEIEMNFLGHETTTNSFVANVYTSQVSIVVNWCKHLSVICVHISSQSYVKLHTPVNGGEKWQIGYNE